MGSITIVGSGIDAGLEMSPATLDRLRSAGRVIVSGADDSIDAALQEAGIDHMSLADLGENDDPSHEQVVESLARIAEGCDVTYVTSGYPFLNQRLLSDLLLKSRRDVNVYPFYSPFQLLLMAFDIDLTADLHIVDAKTWGPSIGDRGAHLVITGVHNGVATRKVADRLASLYSPDHEVVLAAHLADGGFSLSMSTVGALKETCIPGIVTVYVGPWRLSPPSGFSELVRIIGQLRGPDGCPWDREQDHMSLRRHLIEEAHETVAAIESADPAKLAEELGDVLLQVVLHAQIASETGDFTVNDVVDSIVDKIRRRHPHVFGDAVAETSQQVTANWDAIKRGESSAGLLDEIPRSLPALMLAQKISRRVVGVGFEWATVDDVWAKIHEEIDEVKAAPPGSPQVREEIGDLLFTIVNLARKHGIEAEDALKESCSKFTGRWQHVEAAARSSGKNLEDMSSEELEGFWLDAKRSSRQSTEG